MKNIFKKNSIIITALAVMIVIAGYLSFTQRDLKDASKKADATSGNELYDEFVASDALDLATNTTDPDNTTTDNETGNDTLLDTEATDTDITDTDATDTEATDDTTDTEAIDTEIDNADELGDISDEDILANAKDVADNGELNLEEGVPGEAVLVNTAEASYFITRKIDREQVRARNKDTYMEIIGSPDIDDKDKQIAIQNMIALADISEKESAAEMLLEAKGFDGVVVFVVDGKANVVVDAETLTDQQLAIIEDVVKNKTGISVENIEITNVVVAD